MRSAWDLHKAWNNSNLVIIKDAGHSMLEKSIQSELINYTNSFIEL